MGNRNGSFLERTVSVVFEKAGYKTELNKRLYGYEIDVYASDYNKDIIIECKQYDKSYLNVKNILHQWASKNTIIKADIVVVIISGQVLTDDEYKLSRDLGVVLIGDDILYELIRTDNDNLPVSLDYYLGNVQVESSFIVKFLLWAYNLIKR